MSVWFIFGTRIRREQFPPSRCQIQSFALSGFISERLKFSSNRLCQVFRFLFLRRIGLSDTSCQKKTWIDLTVIEWRLYAEGYSRRILQLWRTALLPPFIGFDEVHHL